MTDVPKKQPIPGFASEDLHFDTVEGPEGYPTETDGPVDAVAVSVNGLPAGFFWKGKDESLGFERAARARPQANNLAVSINVRLLEGYESGLSAAETFTKTTIWLEQEWVVLASADSYPSLDRLRQLAAEANPVMEVSVLSRIQGALLGGAIGDALGYPVEFDSLSKILSVTKDEGVASYLAARRLPLGAISDDTQMTLFTAEAISNFAAGRGAPSLRDTVAESYLNWYATQMSSAPASDESSMAPGGLSTQAWLYSRRAPGTTVMGALSRVHDAAAVKDARNDSKGCGTVMRSAPFGLVPSWSTEKAFDEAFLASKITHGHPTAAASAGVFAALVRGLSSGAAFGKSLRVALQLASRLPGGVSDETLASVRHAVALAGDGGPSFEKTATLGGGWVAEEALAIAVYCVLSYPERDDVHRALTLAVTHSGDSDSTGSICGNLLGALHGRAGLPAELVDGVEGREALLDAASALAANPCR